MLYDIAAAQRRFDRMSPFDVDNSIDEEEEEIPPEFSCEWIESEIIVKFAEAEDADKWLEDNGVKEQYGKSVIGADLLQQLAKTWMHSKLAVFEASGVMFWTVMRQIACEVYAYKYKMIVR